MMWTQMWCWTDTLFVEVLVGTFWRDPPVFPINQSLRSSWNEISYCIKFVVMAMMHFDVKRASQWHSVHHVFFYVQNFSNFVHHLIQFVVCVEHRVSCKQQQVQPMSINEIWDLWLTSIRTSITKSGVVYGKEWWCHQPEPTIVHQHHHGKEQSHHHPTWCHCS